MNEDKIVMNLDPQAYINSNLDISNLLENNNFPKLYQVKKH